MATLALTALGSAVGSSVLPAGFSLLGSTITGATIGGQIGALAGSFIDQELFGTSGDTKPIEGPRLRDLHVTASTEGAPIPKLYGRARLGGQVIWATDYEEEVVTTQAGGSGKGGLGGGGGAGPTRQDYIYYGNFAVAIAEGEITSLGRVWADGQEIDITRFSYRFYHGSETQQPDSLIAAREGSDAAPAYRGVAYIVFERLALAEFGNRIPQFSFEVFRAVDPFGDQLQGIVMIPGSGEFVYATEPVHRYLNAGETESENVHTKQAATDWAASINQMESILPNAKSISLVVSWFGTDLRAGHCEVKPGVENQYKNNGQTPWKVGDVDRLNAYVVSEIEGRPAYGGTPADFSVIQGIRDLNARGMNVTLTPFILMDIGEDNTLPNPYGGASQPVYPWRGRITVHPASGQAGSPDKTSAAGNQIASFVGVASPSDFQIDGETVRYNGPNEWSYRRMVLHQAYLAKVAGGVDSFLIGTELRGLTWVRDSNSHYPFVDALVALADDVKGILGSQTKVTYAADWTEYFGHQPSDGTGDVYFHLDPLWASSSIDAVGIDCYWPLSDWRDGQGHLDYQDGVRSPHDLAYLAANVRQGEGYDWYYASQQDRDAQVRTPITDGNGKPWVFRYKDVKSWWSNPHYNRPDGTETTHATAWVAQSKPIWLMEIGSPAVDKGANQPNVFGDPKSSEDALPYYSSGARDDLMQRRYLAAIIAAFDPASEYYETGGNPVSNVYGGRMVPLNRIFAYCWDARPYPAFPFQTDLWGDGENWRLGHWISGRMSSVPLNQTVGGILSDAGFNDYDASGLVGTVPGYVIDRPMSARDALQSLGLAFFFDSVESGGLIKFRHRGQAPAVASLDDVDMVETAPSDPLMSFTRSQTSDLPGSARLSYVSAVNDYQQGTTESRRLNGGSQRISQAELPVVLEAEQVGQIADSWLFETWAARDRLTLGLPPSQLPIEPGDVVEVQHANVLRPFRITEISDDGMRAIEARSLDRNVYNFAPSIERPARTSPAISTAPVLGYFLDLPLLPGQTDENAGYFAANRSPWPGGVSLFVSPENSGFQLRQVATREAIVGETTQPFYSGPIARFDRGNRLRVRLSSQVTSVSPLQLFSGANALAVQTEAGPWEVIQFEQADLVDNNLYELHGLLRGQLGTENDMSELVPAGAPVVVLNSSIFSVGLSENELRVPLNWRFGPSSRDIGDASYQGTMHTFQGLGLRPYAPVHVHATRTGNGVALNWKRRTRIGGDNWEAVEIPLGETREEFEVDIYDGDDVVRTLSSETTSVTYSDADLQADFGSVPSQLSVRVYQLSTVFGRGSSTRTTLTI